MSSTIQYPPPVHNTDVVTQVEEKYGDAVVINLERLNTNATELSTTPTQIITSPTQTTTTRNTRSGLPAPVTAAQPKSPSGHGGVCGFICFLVTLAAVGGIIYGIYCGVHNANVHNDWVAQTQADEAHAKDLADQMEYNATVYGPQVLWAMLQEMKAFKTALIGDMQELRNAVAAIGKT